VQLPNERLSTAAPPATAAPADARPAERLDGVEDGSAAITIPGPPPYAVSSTFRCGSVEWSRMSCTRTSAVRPRSPCQQALPQRTLNRSGKIVRRSTRTARRLPAAASPQTTFRPPPAPSGRGPRARRSARRHVHRHHHVPSAGISDSPSSPRVTPRRWPASGRSPRPVRASGRTQRTSRRGSGTARTPRREARGGVGRDEQVGAGERLGAVRSGSPRSERAPIAMRTRAGHRERPAAVLADEHREPFSNRSGTSVSDRIATSPWMPCARVARPPATQGMAGGAELTPRSRP
jgi:hypothetical protein